MMEEKPITERSNELSSHIDVCDSLGILRVLRATDGQLFSGFEHHPGLLDPSFLQTLGALAATIAARVILPHLDGDHGYRVILSGSGTSGRLAFFCSRTFNAALGALGHSKDLFSYLIAGGDSALVAAQETAEDDPVAGAKALEVAARGMKHVVFIGITCGLSAPYVAGQLDWALAQGEALCTPVLLGFNPIHLARERPIEGWDKTFRQVALRLANGPKGRAYVLTPVVGPEAVVGSTRMKGGSATNIILDALFSTCIAQAYGVRTRKDASMVSAEYLAQCATRVVEQYAVTAHRTYEATPALAKVLDAAARCLASGGRLHYLGNGSAGILGQIDSSECPPTYGASFSDVRGFVAGGWEAMNNAEGDVARTPKGYVPSRVDDPRIKYNISVEDFCAHVVPHLRANDVVIALCIEGELDQTGSPNPIGSAITSAVKSAAAKGAQIAYVSVAGPQEGGHTRCDTTPTFLCDTMVGCTISLPALGAWGCPVDGSRWFGAELGARGGGNPPVFGEFALKLALNAISTGAHVMVGKVFGNLMVDVTVSNNKLYYRAISIVAQCARVDPSRAEECLLQSIYAPSQHAAEEGKPSSPHTIPPPASCISDHIRAAFAREKVVPVALLLAMGKYDSVWAANRALETQPVLRKLLVPS